MARPKNNPETVNIECKFCKTTFAVNWQKRNKQKYCSRVCSNNDPETKEKNRQGVKNTFEKKYGGHAMTTEKTKENFKLGMLKKYGKEHALQVNVILDRLKRTTMQNHGVECVLSSGSEVRNNIEKNWIKKYGVNNPGKSVEVIDKRRKTRHSNHFQELNTIFRESDIEWIIKEGEYDGYHFSKKYNFKCKKCNNTFDSTVYVPGDVFCELCYPNRKQSGETSLLEFLNAELSGTTINRHDRIILEGKELDFYIPKLNLAIEYNGLYWHKEGPKISKNYHLDKTLRCEKQGIRLIHIFETEWLHKQNIVKSMIRQIVGSPIAKIHGRECEVRVVTKDQKKEFLNTCHIQGNDLSSVEYGLFYKNTLVSVMTFCRSRFDKKYEWEISRFCNALNTKIHGGASKLFSVFLQDYKPKNVVSYSDRRYFSGGVYKNMGMKFDNFTAQGYHYIAPDYKALFNRQMYQKSKLKDKLDKFDASLSEWENMKMNGFDRIWDCGHSKWTWEEPKSLDI